MAIRSTQRLPWRLSSRLTLLVVLTTAVPSGSLTSPRHMWFVISIRTSWRRCSRSARIASLVTSTQPRTLSARAVLMMPCATTIGHSACSRACSTPMLLRSIRMVSSRHSLYGSLSRSTVSLLASRQLSLRSRTMLSTSISPIRASPLPVSTSALWTV